MEKSQAVLLYSTKSVTHFCFCAMKGGSRLLLGVQKSYKKHGVEKHPKVIHINSCPWCNLLCAQNLWLDSKQQNMGKVMDGTFLIKLCYMSKSVPPLQEEAIEAFFFFKGKFQVSWKVILCSHCIIVLFWHDLTFQWSTLSILTICWIWLIWLIKKRACPTMFFAALSRIARSSV